MRVARDAGGLPRRLSAHQTTAFRIPVGPALAEAEVRCRGQIGEVRVNGEVCIASANPAVSKPSPNRPFSAWHIPRSVASPVAGSVVIDALAATDSTIHWVEIAGR